MSHPGPIFTLVLNFITTHLEYMYNVALNIHGLTDTSTCLKHEHSIVLNINISNIDKTKMYTFKITTTEMHTAGELVRILESGVPKIQGRTLLDKIRYTRENLDHIRKLAMLEPRGHHDTYGVIPVEADVPNVDFAVIFIHTEGYATMCGHAVISLGRYAIDKGLVKYPTSPETRVGIQCPCGPVEAFVEYKNGKTGGVRFNNVPAYLYQKDVTAEVPGYGHVTVDISYGGAFYAIVPADRLGLDVKTSPVEDLRKAAGATTDTLRQTLKLTHPDNDELAFMYGAILTDGNDAYSDQETNDMCVFADKQVDRSPCGSGVTARIALQYGRGLIQLNQQRTFVSPTGGKFKARAVRKAKCGPHDAVVVEVSGKGFYTGSCTFTLEDGDEIGKGFLLT